MCPWMLLPVPESRFLLRAPPQGVYSPVSDNSTHLPPVASVLGYVPGPHGSNGPVPPPVTRVLPEEVYKWGRVVDVVSGPPSRVWCPRGPP